MSGKIAEGETGWTIDGRPMAVDDVLIQCGCPSGSNRLVAPCCQCPGPSQGRRAGGAHPYRVALGASLRFCTCKPLHARHDRRPRHAGAGLLHRPPQHVRPAGTGAVGQPPPASSPATAHPDLRPGLQGG
ncbi:hypothetical protein [Pseudomonas vranovensis]